MELLERQAEQRAKEVREVTQEARAEAEAEAEARSNTEAACAVPASAVGTDTGFESPTVSAKIRTVRPGGHQHTEEQWYMDVLLTIPDLCKRLGGRSPNTVYELLKAQRNLAPSDTRRLKVIRFSKGRNASIFVEQGELDRWLKVMAE